MFVVATCLGGNTIFTKLAPKVPGESSLNKLRSSGQNEAQGEAL
jgi:hypothetical protein